MRVATQRIYVMISTDKNIKEFNDDLLCLENAVKEIQETQLTLKKESPTCFGVYLNYDHIIKKIAPIALNLYQSLNDEISMPIMTAINRFRNSNYLPESIKFWKDADIIEDLYYALYRNGCYTNRDR